jgi:hypothetical protein
MIDYSFILEREREEKRREEKRREGKGREEKRREEKRREEMRRERGMKSCREKSPPQCNPPTHSLATPVLSFLCKVDLNMDLWTASEVVFMDWHVTVSAA